MSNQENILWLNEEFVLKIVKTDLNVENVHINNFTCEPATRNGDNYSSVLYRLKVSFSEKDDNKIIQSKSYIVKCMLMPETDTGKLMEDLGVFKKEYLMYSETLIKMESALKTINFDLNVSPKFIYGMENPFQLLVIEDLQAEGFKMANRVIGLDKTHCELIFERIAKFHAVSMYLNRRDVKFRESYNRGTMYENMAETFIDYFKNGVSQAITVMEKLPECQKYADSFRKYLDRMIASGIKLFRKIPDDCFDYKVLNHGDFWLNNILFKYDDHGNPVDVRFVDFQLCYFGNCGIDINYFLITSPSEDTRDMYRCDLLTQYHSKLCDVLKKFNYDAHIPTFDDVLKELYLCKDIALMTTCIVLPLVKMDPKTSSNITTDDILDNISSESRQNLFNNELYEISLTKALKNLEDIGYIDNI